MRLYINQKTVPLHKNNLPMKKTLITLTLCIMASITGCRQTKNPQIYDEGAVINGVKWATRNVDEAGTFAPTPESAGKFYQWNRKKAWNTTDHEVAGWDYTTPGGKEWEKTNDPSPDGWRVPAIDEMKSLFDKEKVSSEWTTQNGVNGTKFTDKTNGNSIFLPASGYRRDTDGMLIDAGSYGSCLSSTWYGTFYDIDFACFMCFYDTRVRSSYGSGYIAGNYGRSVRSVAE
jgi:hypothetical protein